MPTLRPTPNKAEGDRRRHRQIVVENSALVDLLDRELCPARPPDIEDTDREVWAKAGERRLVERLLALRAEASRSASIPILGGA